MPMSLLFGKAADMVDYYQNGIIDIWAFDIGA